MFEGVAGGGLLSRASLLIPEQTQLLYRSAAGLDPTEVPPDMLTQSRRERPEPSSERELLENSH